MSFTLTYRDLASPHFGSAMRKLINSDKWKAPKTAYNVAKIVRLVDQELQTFQVLRLKFKEKWKESPSGDVDMQTDMEQFAQISFEIQCHRVDFGDLAGIALTPLEIGALEPMLDNLPV